MDRGIWYLFGFVYTWGWFVTWFCQCGCNLTNFLSCWKFWFPGKAGRVPLVLIIFKISHYVRLFFSLQVPKLKAKKTQTQGNFPKNSRKFPQKLINPANFKTFLPFPPFATKISLQFWPKSPQAKAITRNSRFFPQKLQKFQETQGNFPKTQAKFLKNSIYRKVHSPKLPPKRRKKNPALDQLQLQ